jgi:hypothetical protein
VTFTPAASATPLPPTPVAQKLDTLDVLKGVLESSPADAVWTVRATTDAARVAVDVARLDNLPADLAAGQAVELEGRWKGSARFMAEHLRRYGPALCTRGEVQGRVARIGGGELVLEGGEYFVERADRPPEAANGPAAVGARVRVVFEQCTAIRYLVSVEVIDAPTPAPSQVVGRVNTVADGELRLSGIAGRPMDFEALVRFDPATVQLSGPGPLAPGAVVAATGQWESDTVFRATALEIRRPAPTPAAPTPSLTPPATTPTPGGLGAPVGSPTPPEAVAPEPVGPALIGPRR